MPRLRKNPEPVVNRTITVPYDTMQKLVEYAEKEGVSVNVIINEAIKKFIEEGGKDED